MRIVTNEQMVGRNRKMATYLFFFSLAVLILGFFFANGSLLGFVSFENLDPGVYLIAMPLTLIVGFATTMFSVRLTNLWVRVPRPEDAIQDGLKGISNKSALYNYFHLPARHVLVTPQGIFPIVTRFQDGRITVKGKRVRVRRGPVSSLLSIFRMDSIGNPIGEANAAADYLQYLIEDYDSDIPIYPVIVFHDPRVKLEIVEESPIPVVHASSKSDPSLRDFVRSKPVAQQFDTNQKLSDFLEAFEEYTL
jgi:hypothetical protein